MLVLTRQRDETIMIGDDIKITVVDIRGDKVRLGISAPNNVIVHRQEVYDAVKRETGAAPSPAPHAAASPPSANNPPAAKSPATGSASRPSLGKSNPPSNARPPQGSGSGSATSAASGPLDSVDRLAGLQDGADTSGSGRLADLGTDGSASHGAIASPGALGSSASSAAAGPRLSPAVHGSNGTGHHHTNGHQPHGKR